MRGDEQLPRLLSGRYRLESILGQGGMGVVYGGVDLLLKRPIAVKLIRGADGEQLDDEIAGRFLREAKNTARLHHEHIIELFDLGRTDEGSLYFVMELLTGESLSARLRRERLLSPESAVHIGVQICTALNVAHASGVIHRDLKPANIMLVSRAGDDEFVKVLDFGVAKSVNGDAQTQLTHTGMLVGTIDYMAPEQIMGRTVDGRTDIYSFGVLLYRMLCGIPPFRDNGVPSLVNAHLHTPPNRPSSVVRGIPSALDRVVLRCLEKAPQERFGSMSELAHALASSIAADSMAVGILDDPYERDRDRTVVAPVRIPPAARRPPEVRRPDDATDVNGPVFDETTIRIGAKPSSAPPPRMGARLPPVQVPQPRRSPSAAPPAPRPGGVGACAMCHTLNPPHARMCGACGVSLSIVDQAAVRDRVNVGPRSTPPPTPPPGRDPVMSEESDETLGSIWSRLRDWTRFRNRG